jgi:hypothetical protein
MLFFQGPQCFEKNYSKENRKYVTYAPAITQLLQLDPDFERSECCLDISYGPLLCWILYVCYLILFNLGLRFQTAM